MEIKNLSGGTPEEIIRFMRSFVRMTKAHIGIHDMSYSTSVGCGENDNICEYCKTKCGRFLEKCKDDDKKYLDIAMESGKITVFSCHLGVVGVIIPIFEGDRSPAQWISA